MVKLNRITDQFFSHLNLNSLRQIDSLLANIIFKKSNLCPGNRLNRRLHYTILISVLSYLLIFLWICACHLEFTVSGDASDYERRQPHLVIQMLQPSFKKIIIRIDQMLQPSFKFKPEYQRYLMLFVVCATRTGYNNIHNNMLYQHKRKTR